MAARLPLQIITGPSRSHRAGRIDALLRESGGRARLLVPSLSQARSRREAYLLANGGSGAWGMPVWSLTDFAHQLLEAEGVAVSRLQSAFQRSQVLEHCLAHLKETMPETHLARIPTTPGLVQHLLRVMNDLKQAAIEPEEFSKRLAKAAYQTSFDEGVAALYQIFQDYLRDNGLFDVAGLYWLADDIARDHCPRLLEEVDALFFDGFDDFTPSEFRFLEAILTRTKRGVIGLNLDDAPDRQDRYALPRETLRKLQERFDCQLVACEGQEPRTYAEFAAQHLFWREEPAPPAGLRENVAIVPCSDALHELETVARRIKGLVVEEGVAPGEIAVVSWNLSRIGGALRSVFGRFGIPGRLTTQRALSETGLGRTVVNLLCNTGNWEREGILDLLASPYLRTALWGETSTDASLNAIDAAAYHTRRAQVFEGHRDWTFRLERLKSQVEREESKGAAEIVRRRPNAAAELDALLRAVAALHELQGALSAEETPHALAMELDQLVNTFDAKACPPEEDEVLPALRTLLELLADAPDRDTPLLRKTFLERFARAMDESTIPIRGTGGGVACLDAEGARNQRFAHVFVVGLMEGQVPATPPGNAVYPEHDRERLIDVGIYLETNQTHHAQQRMLFGHVLECAEESLTLSWPVTQESGRESSPSPFLTDVRELLPAAVVAPYPRADSFLPVPAQIACVPDLVNRALYDLPELAVAFDEEVRHGVIGVKVEEERQSAAAFGPYDGVLSDPQLIQVIAANYGEMHAFSVAQLETYLSCPFSFYAQRILHLEDTELPDGTVTPLVRGSLLHEVLQRFHAQFAGLHVRDIGLGKADAAMEEVVAEVFADQKYWTESSAPPAARTAEQAHLLTRLKRYLRVEHAQEKEGDWKPAHFEVAFGRTCTGEDAAPSTEEPFEMALPGGPVRFTGRIDRIDRDENNARLIDYKSGSVPGSGEITSGQSIQLSVYAEAVEQHVLPGSRCTEARYLAVGKTERREALGLEQKRYNWPSRVENMKAAIERAIADIRRGYFPPTRAGKSCYGCGHARACRHEEARVERKSEGR